MNSAIELSNTQITMKDDFCEEPSEEELQYLLEFIPDIYKDLVVLLTSEEE